MTGIGGPDVCADGGTAQADAAAVAADEAAVQADTMDSFTQSLTDDLSRLQSDQVTFNAAQAAAPSYSPNTSTPSASDIAAATASGQGVLSKWSKDTIAALAAAKATTGQAQGIADKVSAAAKC